MKFGDFDHDIRSHRHLHRGYVTLADTSNAGTVAAYNAQGQTTPKAWLSAPQRLPCLADRSNSDVLCRIHQDKRRSKLGRALCICPVCVSADTPNASGCVEYTRINDAQTWQSVLRLLHLPCLQIDSSLTHRYLASSKLETKTHLHHPLPLSQRIANAGHHGFQCRKACCGSEKDGVG
jgi:hypothetical protein